MKFRDGMWLPAADKRLEYAEEVYSITEREDGKALSLLCPTRKIFARADSLNLSTLTVVCSFTASDALVADYLRRI
jgi:alpha-D-xyloside xylohydrolase